MMQDLLRFFLALSVVLFHYKHFAVQTALSLPPSDYIPPYNEVLNIFYVHGYHAVAAFFFLSGYMLAIPLGSSINPNFNYRNFILKRLARIYPAHLITLLCMGLLAILINALSLEPFITYNDNPINFMASIFLLNGTGIMRDTSFNLPAWSLSVELFCYLTFGAICRSQLKAKATAFMIGLLIGVAINEIFQDPNTSNLGSGMVFFFAGAITATKFKPTLFRIMQNHSLILVLLLFVSCLSFWLSLQLSLGLQKVIWLFVSLPTFVISINAFDTKMGQTQHRPLAWFGLMSFSIYIWHFPIQSLLHYLLHDIEQHHIPVYNSAFLFWIYVPSVLIVAHISLITIEKWGSSFIRSFEKS